MQKILKKFHASMPQKAQILRAILYRNVLKHSKRPKHPKIGFIVCTKVKSYKETKKVC